ncbi:P-loop containing nucleoside triphosphate hydrolase [Sesbania bispinosa]|nr:P-loop containing nucleoside triphosphate hydrolase [Sesbania bispinosa]
MIKDNPKTQDEALNKWPGGCYELQGGSSNGFEVSESITSTLNGIMMALTDTDIIVLGVYGSNDVRKGKVVEKITRRVKRDNLFDVVVMASVMKKPDFKRIQRELGNMLGLQLNEKTPERRASRLCDRIKKVKKILIILDDLWGGINLGRIGIPFGNDHKGFVPSQYTKSGKQLLCHLFLSYSDKHNTESQVEELSKERNVQLACFIHQKQAIIFNCYEVSGLINFALEGTVEALVNPNINIVGVYGSSTLRKTNLIEKISRRIKRDNLFDTIVMASVTEKPDLKRIQGEIGNMLGLQFGEEAVVERAKRLCDRIKKEQRILVILDDLWDGINLERVGIPFENDHKGCKIVFISRCQSRSIV